MLDLGYSPLSADLDVALDALAPGELLLLARQLLCRGRTLARAIHGPAGDAREADWQRGVITQIARDAAPEVG